MYGILYILDIENIILPMSRKTDTLLVHVRLDEELLERIDDFRFENRFEDRTRAIRWLLKWALNHSNKSKKPAESVIEAP